MKALLKAIARPFWRGLAPLRQRIATKFDQHLTHLVTVVVHEHVVASTLPRLDEARSSLGRIETSVNTGRSISENVAADTNLLLDSLVREMGRLQMQIEALHDALEDARQEERLGLVSENGDDQPIGEIRERMRAG
jgi:hypothetical protein